jgi:predicted nucleic acid-binding protein
MGEVLVDSNVILDVASEDQHWYTWSSRMLAELGERHIVLINPIIYAAVSAGYTRVEDVDAAIATAGFERRNLPWEAAFLAGQCFVRYRRQGGARRSPLPDFYIGAHAAVRGMMLLTRDAKRYRSYFPQLRLIAPEAE